MGKYIIKIFFIIYAVNLLARDFKILKEKKFEIYYERDINPYVTEYVLNILKDSDSKITEKFNFTNSYIFKVVIYNDLINFINDRVGNFNENYVFKSNIIYIQNIELLMQQNILHSVINYALTRYQLILNFDTNIIPEWFLTGISLYISNLNFSDSGIIFKNFDELINFLKKSSNSEKFKQACHNLYNGISYLLNRFTFEKIIEFLNNCKAKGDFENLFFQFFGLKLQDYKNIILNKY